MTTCDHGIRLDAFCGNCEAGPIGCAWRAVAAFPSPHADHHPLTRRQSGRVAAGCLLAAIALVALAWAVSR